MLRCLYDCVRETMASEFGKNMYKLHQDFVTAYKTRFTCENMHAATVQCSSMWQKMRKEYKTFPTLQSQVLQQIKEWKKETVSNRKGTIQSLWKNSSKKGIIHIRMGKFIMYCVDFRVLSGYVKRSYVLLVYPIYHSGRKTFFLVYQLMF